MKKKIKFTKMQGLGNDFILVDYKDAISSGKSYEELAVKMCDRNFGIGGDGLIIVNPDDMKSTTDTSWRIINSDGSEPQMCGNGIRCFAKYALEKGFVSKNKFTVNTLAGVITPEVLEDGRVKVDMGAPILEGTKIPTTSTEKMVLNFPLQVDDKTFNINAISMGNPHCIIFTDEDSKELAVTFGAKIEKHAFFPEKTNVEFVKVLSRNHVKIDVWERGCGITLACGTGTCATGVAAMLNGLTDSNIKADLPGGTLEISWNKEDLTSHVFMTGESEFVFEGEFFI